MPHSQETMMSLARRLVTHYKAGTTDSAPEVMAQTMDAYVGEERMRREIDAIFKHYPLAMALSLELPEPGTYKAVTFVDTPVLMTRAKDGAVRAFVNVCRHRGAPVCEVGCGKATRFACPYHSWTFDNQGKLVGIFGEKTFGDVDADELGLTPLPCEERSGLVWVVLTPGETMDLEGWLAGFDKELDGLDLTDWHIYQQREFEGPVWKVAWDGYLEGYHQAAVHPETVGKNTIANLMTFDPYGAHQRIVYGRKTLAQMAELPEEEWDPDFNIRLVHSVFPNVSFSGVLQDFCLISQVYPGPIDRTTTIQTVLTKRKPGTAEEEAAAAEFSEMGRHAVQEEDYGIGFSIQAGLASKGNSEFLFGRNEPSLQHYHQWVERLSADA